MKAKNVSAFSHLKFTQAAAITLEIKNSAKNVKKMEENVSLLETVMLVSYVSSSKMKTMNICHQVGAFNQ